MRLVSVVVGFLLRKAGLLLGIVLSLFLGYLLVQAAVPAVKEAVTDRERLQQVTRERAALTEDLERLRSEVIAAQAEATRTQIAAGAAELAERKAAVESRRGDLCSRLQSLPEQLSPVGPNPCEDAERALETAEDAVASAQRTLDEAEAVATVLDDPALTPQQKLERLSAGGVEPVGSDELADTEAERDRKAAEERELRRAQGSGIGWVVDQWAQSWRWLAAIAALALVLPPLLRVLSYFVLMPIVKRAHRPIHLSAGSEDAAARLDASASQRTLAVELADGEVLSARSEHVRPVQGAIRGRLLYDWSAPFISFAAGLYGLSEVTGDEHGTAATLSTPHDPDSYLMRIDFADHPGVVMRPRHVVGVIGSPRLEARWRFGLQAFATWQVRYIMFAGTGSLIVQGTGDVVATSPRGRSTRIEQTLMMGFDSRLAAGVNRTEVFWPYLWGKTPLVDDEFTGDQPLFWQKSSSDGPSNPVARTFDAFFSALGKVFGF